MLRLHIDELQTGIWLIFADEVLRVSVHKSLIC